jgi:hypothetical protein
MLKAFAVRLEEYTNGIGRCKSHKGSPGVFLSLAVFLPMNWLQLLFLPCTRKNNKHLNQCFGSVFSESGSRYFAESGSGSRPRFIIAKSEEIKYI